MPPDNFPLRWESTRDQWWYASPIDWAAANGLYDLVRELLHLDTNLLIKLTSLRRIRRLETVWDDEAQFDDVAKCRSQVARKLLMACETKGGHNSLIRAGYGGWLLYTAASAGDVGFVTELLERDPLLVYGEGEYGVTDLFYAAARSKSCDVFRLLLDFSVSPRCSLKGGGDLEEQLGCVSTEIKWEMMNRAVHALARGGNLEMLRELLGDDGSDILTFRDAQGFTILHTASGRGQVEVVKNLVESSDIISSTDHQGNTALHVAAYRGYLAVVEVLLLASPSLSTLPNKYGDTFLHMAVAGFRAPGFRRIDRQIELMKQLLCGDIVRIQDIINVRNNDGRTALHMAVNENMQINLVELLMTAPSINLNIRDAEGMTPLDLLRQRPQSASSEILIKQLISAGGISNCQDHKTRSALVSHLKMHGIGTSPGTSFRIPDAEIFLYTGIENASDASYDQISEQFSTYSGELSQVDLANSLSNKKKPGSVNSAARRLKFLLGWPRRKDKNLDRTDFEDDDSLDSFNRYRDFEENHIPLRQIYSKSSSLSNNRRTFSVGSFPSPSTKMKFAAGLMHGVIKTMPHLTASAHSSSSTRSGSSMSSPAFMDKQKRLNMNSKPNSMNKRLMNQYLSFGAQGLEPMEDYMSCTGTHQSHRQFSSLVA
ncbi:Transmembrane protein [Parasponia andersonii]|uniref:Transmembrane protein n=1 Tax=Parasponia andersonii TaxID=3476 RepID=A0A2P5CUZ2_PARAD|nr:Transmembrane protein [Parasponia andersonii]